METLVQLCTIQNTAEVPAKMKSIHSESSPEQQSEDTSYWLSISQAEDTEQTNYAHALMTNSWDTSLLTDWISPRDRINRWMLHMLGSEIDHANTHRQICERDYTTSTSMPDRLWSRLVFKHWFTDEAAIGFDVHAAGGINEQLNAVNSSLHLSARPSGTESAHQRESRQKLALLEEKAGRRGDITANSMIRDKFSAFTGQALPREQSLDSTPRSPQWIVEAKRKRDASTYNYAVGSMPTRAASSGSSFGSIDERLHSPVMVETSSRTLMEAYDGINPPYGFKCDYPGCTAVPFQTMYLLRLVIPVFQEYDSRINVLSCHKNVHSNVRNHFCPVEGCPRSKGGRGFKRKNEMIRHGLVYEHRGYMCPFCPEEHKYPRPYNLQRYSGFLS
jgi:hypothetical protein